MLFKGITVKKKVKEKSPLVDLIVVRVCKAGTLKMAKPCKGCLEIIKTTGVRYVYYSTTKGYINRELAKNMQTDHLCASARALLRNQK